MAGLNPESRKGKGRREAGKESKKAPTKMNVLKRAKGEEVKTGSIFK